MNSLHSASLLLSCLFLCTLVPIQGLAQDAATVSEYTNSESTNYTKSAFLMSLQGQWEMKGRFRFKSNGDWIPTRSSMNAKIRLSDRALVREIEAPQINFTAVDIIWYDEQVQEYTYVYLNSQSSQPVIMKGTQTNENEISVNIQEPAYRTVITLLSTDEMVARDFELDDNGKEWMSREVFHYRKP